MSQYVVESGSSSSGVTSKRPYDAMVYQDGTYTVAVDSEGNLIKKVLTSANTDDVAIQAAIDSGNKIFVDNSSYAINDTLILSSNREFFSNGATLTLVNSVDKIMIDLQGDVDNLLISGFNLDGNAVNQTDSEIIALPSTYCDIISRSNYGNRTRVCIKNNTFINYKCYAINADNYNYACEISGNSFTNGGVAAIRIHGSWGCDVKSNYIYVSDPTELTGFSRYYGIVCDGIGNTISNNYIYVKNVSKTYAVRPLQCIEIRSDGTSLINNNNIVSNTLIGDSVNREEYGIVELNAGYTKSTSISRNYFRYFLYAISTVGENTSIKENTIRGISSRAIGTGETSYNIIIDHNYIESDVRCIHLYKTVGARILNNTFVPAVGDYAIYEATSPVGKSIIENNRVVQGYFIYSANNSITIQNNEGYVHISEIRDALNNTLEILGDARLLLPQVEITGTSITDYTRLSNTLTAQASVATWYGFQGRATYYDFNGTSHYLYRANDTDFDFGDGAGNDTAFSVVMCLNVDTAASRFLIGKWDENNQREWRVFLDANGYPTIQLYDESADKYVGRQDQTAFTTGSWKVLVTTYSASKTSAGCKIYIDGVQLDDADYEDAGYVSMDVVTSNLQVGALKNAAAYSEYYDGKMTWIGVCASELTADQVWSLTQRLKGVLGI